MRWAASSTTTPASTSVLYSLNSPPEASPRQILKVAVAILFGLLVAAVRMLTHGGSVGGHLFSSITCFCSSVNGLIGTRATLGMPSAPFKTRILYFAHSSLLSG